MTSGNNKPLQFFLKYRRGILSLFLCIAVLSIGKIAFSWLTSLKQPPDARTPVTKVYNVEVFDVEREDIQEIISGFGTAHADRKVVLSAKVSGEIIDVHPRLEVGEAVRTAKITIGIAGQSQRSSGDLLVQIDPKTYIERVDQAENKIAEDKVEILRVDQEQKNNVRLLSKATVDYETNNKEYLRIKDLREKGVTSRSELTRAMLELQKYEDTVIRYQNEKVLFPIRREQILSRQRTHQTEKMLIEIDLSHTEVRPPFSGILSDVLVEKGQYVRPGDPLVKLMDLSEVEIAIPLALSDYAKISSVIQNGKQLFVGLAENETAPVRWRGYVSRVAPEADELTRTVNIFVQVDNSKQDIPLLPGTFVHARIDGPILNKVVVIPRDAVSKGTFFVAMNGRAMQRTTTIKQTLQSLAVVDGNLKSGEYVILTNLDIIHEGAEVRIQVHRTLKDELNGHRTTIARQLVNRQSSQPNRFDQD